MSTVMKSYDNGDVKIAGELKELNRGLVLYLDGTYDEENGWFVDKSGHGNHGVPYNGATTGTGVVGDGMSFDGTDDYIDCGNGIDIPNDFSISTWVYLDDYDYGIIDIGTYPSSYRHISIMASSVSNKIIGRIGNNTATVSWEPATNAVSLNTWYHVVLTFSENNYAKIYLNGDLKDSKIVTTHYDLSGYNTILGYLDWGVTNYYYDGQEDEIRIYDRALEPEEIRQLYELGCAKLHDGTNASYDLGDLVVPEIIEGESKMKMTYQNLYCNEITEGVTF